MTSVRVQQLLDALSQAGCKVHSLGTGRWQAQCPAHEDRTPSMSISQNRAGEIGIKCHAGCETGDILKQLGLKWGVLFPDNKGDGRSASKKKTIVKTYPYTNEAGEVLFEVVRFHPKDFRQRQPQVGGGWRYSLKGVRRVIYNLPDVKRGIEEGRPIFLVEGEKDAEALIKRNLIATTCPMGAGKWRTEYSQLLEGAELIILPDNDTPGKKHAAGLVGKLLDHTKTIRILPLPGLKAKEDVSDWLMEGGTKDELLELAFNSEPVQSQAEAEAQLDINGELDENDPRSIKKLFFAEDLKIYSNDAEEKVIADFNIDIQSIVKDDQQGQIFYIKIKEKDRGRRRTTETIEIKPEYLDDLRSFYKAIRPYSMGEILQYRSKKTKPLNIFKWLLQNFDKPIVRRPDHVGFTRSGGRPFWLFGNAVVCPPWTDPETGREHQAQIIEPNEAGEFIVSDKLGFTLPLYDNEIEKEQMAPFINIDIGSADAFLGEVKTNLLTLVGGGDPEGRAHNYGKLLLGYVIYHLYEQQLYYANDMNGHTVMLYVHGPKGTGKTTYFNTILRAFFGLHKTKEIKGNTVTIPGLENTMGMYSQLPVCYDEFNPEFSDVSYQHLNSYYHRTSRSVSDTDRKNRNKFTPIRSTLSITSNYRINLDVDQADATESRTIYFQYKKEYRSDDPELFEWFKANLDRLSSITAYLLVNQTQEKRRRVKELAAHNYGEMKKALDAEICNAPKKYAEEHRLTDNYTRLLAAYELIFGRDNELRAFIYQELLGRFASARSNLKENALLNQLIYLASSGRLKESWQYNYNSNQKELYVDLNQCYHAYEEYRRDKAVSLNQFRDILKDYFQECGGYYTATKRWYGSYYDKDHNRQDVNKPQHSYVLAYEQVVASGSLLRDLFPPTEEQVQDLKRLTKSKAEESPIRASEDGSEEDSPF